MTELALPPMLATIIFVVACVAGYQYRRVWKNEGPKWQLWLFGLIAAAGLLLVGFIPLQNGPLQIGSLQNG